MAACHWFSSTTVPEDPPNYQVPAPEQQLASGLQQNWADATKLQGQCESSNKSVTAMMI
jgi:hypothetical protein